MGVVKVSIKAMKKEDARVLVEKIKQDFPELWIDGPYQVPNGWKTYLTLEVQNDDRR